MSETWKKWEGQVVDHKYQLLKHVGSTDHSVVFLAEFRDPEPRQVAVKFISADFTGREQQLAAWSAAAQLTHANLLRIYGGGICKIEDMELMYVAMEYAEENLAQVLPHRALMAEETSEMLNSVVDVLVYLHGKDLVHGHIKPSNVLAMGESLKVSSDTIYPAGEVREMRRERSAYDAPELPDSPSMPAADVWSLGVTLVEAFTQQPAVLPFNEQADPIIPPIIREPFLEITRNTLRRRPRLRWSSADIAEKLNPTAATAKAVAVGAGAASASGAVASASAGAMATPASPVAAPVVTAVDVPLSQERAVPLAKLPPEPAMRPAMPRPQMREEGVERRETVVLPNYVIPVFSGALVLIALILLPFALRHRASPQASSVVPSGPANATQQPASAANSSVANVPPPVKSVPPPPAPTAARPQPAATDPTASPLANSKSPAEISSTDASATVSKGEVLDQVAPAASAKALATISGTVRVGVKVHVDAVGNVSDATLENGGPSRYFSDLSLKAARQWVFTPPEVNGRTVPSDWVIEFHFTKAGPQMSSEQMAP
ncbi:MAG: TonB family protein [Candidatus Acidiferrum sp.]|jgi:TonB family protein